MYIVRYFALVLGGLLTIGAAAGLNAQPAELLMHETFEDLGLWNPTGTMNQNGWSTTNIVPGPAGQEPVWHHEAHSGPAGSRSPKPHITHRLGNTNLRQGNRYAANLHWRDFDTTSNASHTAGYDIRMTSAPFAGVPVIPSDEVVLTVEFDYALDLLRQDVVSGGVTISHRLSVSLLDLVSGTFVPLVPGFQVIAETQRIDMTRFVYEGAVFPPSSGTTSDWVLVFNAASNGDMNFHLYDWWIDNVKVMMNYQEDFSPPYSKDSYEDGFSPVFHPFGPIDNNNAMTHPFDVEAVNGGPLTPGDHVVLGGAWVEDIDEDYYYFSTDPNLGGGLPVQIVIHPGGDMEAELFRVEDLHVAGVGNYWEKFVRAKSVAYTNTDISAPLHLNAEYHQPGTLYVLRITSLMGPGTMVPYDLEIADSAVFGGQDWYDVDGEGPFGVANNDSPAAATPVFPSYGAHHYLHPGDEDWYWIDVGQFDQILVHLNDLNLSDGIEVSLIQVEPGGNTLVADIDESGPGPWGGHQAEVAHIPNIDSTYFIRVWRYWQTSLVMDQVLEYELTVNVQSTPLPRTVHAPAVPTPNGVLVTMPSGTFTNVFPGMNPISYPPTDFALSMTLYTNLGHADYNYTWSTSAPGSLVANTWPTGSFQISGWFWNPFTVGAVESFRLTEHLYDRTASLDDLSVTIVIKL